LQTTVQSAQRLNQTKHLLLRLVGVVTATASEIAIAIAAHVQRIGAVLVTEAMTAVVRRVGAMVREDMIVTGVVVAAEVAVVGMIVEIIVAMTVVAGMIAEIFVVMTVVAGTEADAKITFAPPKTSTMSS